MFCVLFRFVHVGVRIANSPLTAHRTPRRTRPGAGLEDTKHYLFRIRPVFSQKDGGVDNGTTDEGGEWAWSPASAPASPAVLNSFLRSRLPEELVGAGGQNKAFPRSALAGKIVGAWFINCLLVYH